MSRLWGLVSQGIKEAALVNLIATIAKIVPLVIFIACSFVAFKLDLFKLNFIDFTLQVPVWEQVRNLMLITLWVFTGIEGAVVLSSRAKNRSDIGRATVLGVLLALSLLCVRVGGPFKTFLIAETTACYIVTGKQIGRAHV